jgi:homoserine kinase
MVTFVSDEVAVSVPATSANLGPGFDSLGLALDLRDRVSAQVIDGPSEISVTGEGEEDVPLDESHLVRRSMVAALETIGAPIPHVRLVCRNAIPHGRGLGSSSAAIVAGVALARELVAGGSLLMDDDALFAVAAELEGHPDNVAPAVYGGFTIAYRVGKTFRATGSAVDPRVQVVAFVAPTPLRTAVARGLLPSEVSHADAAANSARTALLVAALGGRPELLFDATEDVLHQPYREPAMPESIALVRDLRSAGHAAVLSGAGPTVLVFTDAAAVAGVAGLGPDGWHVLQPWIDRSGVRREGARTDKVGE